MADLERIAGTFRCSRAMFGQLYDKFSSQKNSDPFIITALGASDDRSAFRQALEAANSDGWRGEFLHAAVEAGLVDVDHATEEEKQVVLQGLSHPQAGFLNPDITNPGGLKALNRVCAVLVDEPSTSNGTGFLVGPQAVLTAWHVVRDLFKANGQPKANVAERLRFRFEPVLGRDTGQTVYEAAEAWHIGSSPCLPEELPGEEGSQLSSGGRLANHLDFACVRLKGLPGRFRGHYTLSSDHFPRIKPASVDLATATDHRMFVWQHPRDAHVFDVSPKGWYEDPATRRRLIYRGNAVMGSSGGLCLDRDFRLVALHQCELKTLNNTHIGNGAIPTALIAEKLDLDAVAQSDSTLERIISVKDRRPVIGRYQLQESIWTLADGDRRILCVRSPSPRSGKSYSIDIMEATLPANSHIFVSLDAVDIPATAHELAQIILDRVESSVAARMPLPNADDADTSDAAWLEQHLLAAVARRIEAAAAGKLVWLVIDGLEKKDLADTGARRFLEVLYKGVRATPALRIVLVGLSLPRVPGANPSDVLNENVPIMNRVEVGELMAQWYVRKSLAPTADELDRLGKLIVEAARDKGGDFAPALGDFCHQVAFPALDLIEDPGQ